uniref:Uncharacterized protein n=1 Tax=Knipowitschia caucasica TaxID=637954 RepID=A0AAV2KD24_KNICA
MVCNYRVPPPFEEGKLYESWKNEVGIWARVTDLEKKKQALAVALSLSGRARETAMEIPRESVKSLCLPRSSIGGIKVKPGNKAADPELHNPSGKGQEWSLDKTVLLFLFDMEVSVSEFTNFG